MNEAWLNILEEIVVWLKVDLGISSKLYDARLKEYIKSAFRSISEEGIVLDADDAEDRQILIMYSAWMWRRRDTMEGMPRMVRFALNNRLFSQKMRGDANG